MMSDQVQTYLQNKERSNQNKILDDSNFVSEDVVDTSDIVSKIEERPVQDQLTTYAEQKQEFQTQKANRTAVQVLSQDNPDENAEAQQLAKDYQTHYNPEFTLPDSIVKNNKDHIQSRVAQRKLTTTLSNSPMLLRWLGNPKNAAVASDDVAVLAEIEAGLDTVGRIVKRGGLKLQQTGYQIGSDLFRYSSEQYGLTFLDRYKLARGQHYGKGLAGDSEAFNEVFSQDFKSEADRQAALSALGEEPVGAFIEALKGTAVDALNSLGDRATQKKDINRAVRLQQRAAEVAKRLEGVEGAEGVDEYLNRFAGGPNGEPLSLTDAIKITTDILSEDPVGFFKMMGQLSLESAVGVAPAIVAAQITRNPGVGAAAMGGTSYMMESAFEAMEFFREQGVDFSDPKAVEALLGDKDLMRDLEVRRHLKALPIALLDTLSAGLAGKVFADNPVADLALQSLVQSASGGLGEALAQNVVRGQVNWGTVLLETFADVGTAPVEVGGIGMRKLGNLRSNADDAEGAAEAIKEVSDGVQQSATRGRAPEVFKDFAQGLAEDSGIESLYVPAEEFFKFLDSKNIPAVELAEKLPGLNIQDLDRARVSNEDIKIPFSEYMATIAGSDMDVFIQENAKFDPEGMTLREAANFRDNEILEEAKVSALQEKMRKLKKENEQVLSQVRDVVEERLRATGRPEEFAKHEAEIFAAFYESVAAYTGKKVSEVVERYKVPLIRAEQNRSPLTDEELEQSALEVKSTPEFKNWFGDSKVVDDAGEPLVVYRGSLDQGESFPLGHKGGIWFTDNPTEASNYAASADMQHALFDHQSTPQVTPAYMTLKNPLVIDFKGDHGRGGEALAEAVDLAKAEGYDGVIAKNVRDGASYKYDDDGGISNRPDDDIVPTTHYIAFDPTQVKSINNKGTFDPNDPRILHQAAKDLAKTPAFKKWFGNSKLVDENGDPQVWYHGTDADIDDNFAFKPSEKGLMGPGIYFTDDYDTAKKFGKNVVAVYLRAENPHYRRIGGGDATSLNDAEIGLGGPGIREGASQIKITDPTQIKSVNNRGTFDPNDPRILYQDAKEMAQTPEFKEWSGGAPIIEPKSGHVYETGVAVTAKGFHGTQRPDRIGEQFRADRATSGPMAFFTDDTDVASGYATGKSDTSIEIDEMQKFFSLNGVSGKGKFRKWTAVIPYETRQWIRENGYKIYEDSDTMEIKKGTGEDGDGQTVSKSHWEWTLKDNRNNPISALFDIWHDGGILFGHEGDFVKVLELAGVPGAKFDDPHATYPAIFPVYINMRNPLVTSDIPSDVVEAIREAAKTAPEPEYIHGVDMWDKRAMSTDVWMERFEQVLEDPQKSYGFTVIPDWVTDVLRSKGFDGVIDLGGKSNDGVKHYVFVPFRDNQVKSIHNTKPTDDPRIMYQLPGLHSTTVKAIASMKQKKGVGPQMWNTIKKLPGVKKDELQWMGLEQWLNDQGKITHDEIMDYVEAHKIDIDETVARGVSEKDFETFMVEFMNDYDSYKRMQEIIEEKLEYKYADSELTDPREHDDYAEYESLELEYIEEEYDKYLDGVHEPERFTSDPDKTIEDPQFEEYTQRGGKSYTELSLQIRGTPLKDKTYHGMHFGPENTFAHARYKTRSKDGTRVMHIEEIQSDLHAQGRDEGYEKQLGPKEVEKIKEAINKARGDLRNAEAAAVKVFDNPEFDQFVDKVLRLGPVDAMNKSTIIQAINYAIRFDTFEEYLAHTQETHKDALENGGEYAQLDAYRRMLVAENITSDMFNKFRDTFRMREESRLRLAEAEGKLHALHDGVLDAPFKGTGWLELTIKRLLAKAVEDGFDAISFNRGIDIAEVSHGTTVHLPDGPVEWTIDKHNKKLYVHTVIRNQLVSVEGLKVYAPDSYAELKASLDAGETEGHFSVADPVDVPSEGFVFEYDQQIPRFLNKYLKQWGAKLEYKDGIVTRIGSDEGVPFVRITPEMRESIQEAGQFYQGPRGRINIPANFDGQSVIDLFRNHDDTSFMHESAHFSLAMMIDVAENAEPDNELVHMYNDTKKWWYENAEAVAKDAGEGVTDKDVRDFLTRGTTYDDAKDKSVYRGLHEQWARGWEKYLMEGKAPNSKLQAVFELFRKIFSKVYSSLQDLDVELNEDIIRVFDRLIAVDDHVEVATEDQNFNMMADSPEKMGITPEDFEELQERFKQAQLETLGETINKAMEGVRRARSKERKEFAKSIKKEVENEINKKPIYRAIEWLGNKRWLGDEDDRKVPEGMRLSKEQLIEREGKEILRKLPRGEKGFRVYTPGGMDLDEAAGWFGYDSGDALIKDMLAVPKRKTAIKDEIAARVAAKFEDGKYEGVETASEVLSTSSKRGSFIAQELKLLNKSLGDMRLAGNLTLKYAREVARESIRTMVTRDAADAKKFLAAERREANKAQEALKAGDTQRAAGHKYSQLFNFAMHAEAKKVIEEQAKLQRLGKRLGKKSTRKKLDPEYMEAIDDILDLYDFRKRSNAQERRQEARNAGLLKYVEMMKEQGRENELAIPQHVLDNAKVRPIKSLTVEEMRGVYASLKNVENTARRSKRLIDKKRQRELDDVALSIEKAFDDNVKRRPPDRVETDREKRNRIIKQAFGAIFTADTLLREIDGFKDGGAVYENLKLGVDEAQARLENRREQAANELESLYDVYTRQEQNQMAVMRDHKFLGGTYAKWDLISIVLNMGNKDNLERLTNPKTRGAFTHAQLNYVLNQMDKRDLDFAQSVWDYIDTYYDEIAEREMRTTGVKPDKVQATALNTPHGEYRGGYYPIKYDARNSDMVRDETNEEIIQNMRIGRFGKAQTRNGHTQSRVESSGRPIRLDLSVLHGHVNAVLHDLELSEEVSNAWRVLQHPRVKNAFLDHGKQVEHEALELWIKDVASGQIAATDGWSWAARKAKSGFTISKLAFNLSTVAIQVTGLGQSAVTIGKKNMYLGLKEWSKDFTGAGAKVAEVSDFMRRRETTFNKDVYDMVGNIKTGPKMGRYKRFMTDVMEPAAFYAMQKVQYNVVDVPTWLGAYQQGLELFEGNEEKAIQHADRAVARSQASGIFGDRSAIERGTLSPTTQQSDFVRLFTTLGSYMFAKANVAYERTKKTDFKDPAEILNYTVDMTLLFTAEAVLYNLIMGTAPAIFGGADEDDEGWTEFLAKETAYSIMGTMPLVRDIASASKGFDSGGAYGSIVKTLTVPLTQLGQGEVDKAAVKAMVNAGGMLFHLPSTQMNRIIDAEWRRQEGDGVSPIEYLMGRSR